MNTNTERVTDEAVAAAARAMYEWRGGEYDWDSLTSTFRASCLPEARVALEAASEVADAGSRQRGKPIAYALHGKSSGELIGVVDARVVEARVDVHKYLDARPLYLD